MVDLPSVVARDKVGLRRAADRFVLHHKAADSLVLHRAVDSLALHRAADSLVLHKAVDSLVLRGASDTFVVDHTALQQALILVVGRRQRYWQEQVAEASLASEERPLEAELLGADSDHNPLRL